MQDGGQIVERITLCLANIALTNEGRNAMVGTSILKLMEDCLIFNSKNDRICNNALSTLSTLKHETLLCRGISHHGVCMLLNATILHIEDTTILSYFVEIICQMTRNKE